MVDETRLLTATALAGKNKRIYATLDTVFIKGQRVEVKTKDALAVTFA